MSVALSQIYTKIHQVPDLEYLTPVKPFEETYFFRIYLRKQKPCNSIKPDNSLLVPRYMVVTYNTFVRHQSLLCIV